MQIFYADSKSESELLFIGDLSTVYTQLNSFRKVQWHTSLKYYNVFLFLLRYNCSKPTFFIAAITMLIDQGSLLLCLKLPRKANLLSSFILFTGSFKTKVI